MALRSAIVGMLLPVALGGCAASGGLGAGSRDWPAYAADVYAMPAPERDALEAEVAADYAAQGGADRALRLAIVLAAPGASDEDLAAALGLLDSAEAGRGAGAAQPTGGDAAAPSDGTSARGNFIGVLRPLLLSIQQQRSALAAESAARESLEAQLEELKSLEESLNAGGPQR